MKKRYKFRGGAFLLATAFTAGSLLCSANAGLAAGDDDTAVKASQLHLEGTKLQLKGDLSKALEKYQQSLKLKPNPALEKLSQRLVEKTGTKTAANLKPETAVETASPAPRPVKPEETAQAAESASETGQITRGAVAQVEPVSAAVHSVHIAANPEEARIHRMINQIIAASTSFDSGEDNELTTFNGLQIDPDYTVTPWSSLTLEEKLQIDPDTATTVNKKNDNIFVVNLGSVGVMFEEGEGFITDSPIFLKVQILEGDRIYCHVIIPRSVSFSYGDTTAAILTNTNSILDGIWDENLQSMTSGIFKMSSPKISPAYQDDSDTRFAVDMDSVKIKTVLDTESADWSYTAEGDAKAFTVTIKNSPVFSIGTVKLKSSINGDSSQTIRNLVKNYVNSVSNFKKSIAINDTKGAVAAGKSFSYMLDTFQEIYRESMSKVELGNISFSSLPPSRSTLHIEDISLEGKGVQSGSGSIDSDGSFIIHGISSLISKGDQQPANIAVEEIRLDASGSMEKIPENFFVESYTHLTPMINTMFENNSDEATAGVFIEAIRDSLSLLTQVKVNTTVRNIVVDGPVSGKLAALSLAQGMNAAGGKDNNIKYSFSFSGLKVPSMGAFMPTDVNIDVKALQLPPLLEIIPDAATTAQLIASDTLQNYLNSQAMELLGNSSVIGVFDNNFITFPNASIKLNGRFQQDSSSPLKTQGKAALEIDNVRNINQTLVSLPGLQPLQGALAMLTALASRTTTDSGTIDTIKLSLTSEGKLMINNKNMTGIFFPQQQAPVTEKQSVNPQHMPAPQ